MKNRFGLFGTAVHHRELIWNFVRRDFKGRYLGSYLGFTWNIIQPVILVTVYTFIFAKLMKMKLNVNDGTSGTFDMALYIFAGMVPWLTFAECLARNTACVLEHGNLIKKVAFPSEILPLSQVLYGLLSQIFGLVILLIAVLLLAGQPPGPRLAWMLLLFPMQLVFTLGVGYFLAALNVFVRDTQQFMNAFMILWMLMTPIFYPEFLIQQVAPALMYTNPQYYLVRCYRWCCLPEGAAAGAGAQGSVPFCFAIYAVIGVVALALGYTFYMRTKHRFADEI